MQKLSRLALEAMVDSIPAGVVVIEKEKGKVTYVNERAIALYGCDPRGLEMPEHSTNLMRLLTLSGEVYPPEQLPASKALLTGQEAKDELIIERPNGSRIIVAASAKPVKDEKGQISAAVAIFEDVTESKKAQEKITYLASFPQLNPDPIVEVDFQGKITYANPTAKKLFPDIEVRGYKHPFLHYLQYVLKTLQDTKQEIVTLEVKADGHWYFQRAYRAPNSQTLRIIGSNIDLRKKAEQDLRQAQAKLQEYANSLEQLVEERTKQLRNSERLVAIGETAGMVGHDIRNPLQAIIGDLYLLKEEVKSIPDGESKQSANETIEVISENISYINKIVADLQDYARKIEPKFEEADLEKLIETAFLAINVPENIHAQCTIEPNLKLKTDPTYIRRIVTNLTTNAIQAMPNGGQLTLQATSKNNGKTIQISVADTGEGIPAEVQDKLFKPLFTTKSKGQGFGLVVVKKFVEALGGTISFESQVGKGTKFIVSLPAQKAQENA